MKIFYIAPCRTKFPSMAASSIHMMKMCEAYAKLGHDISLIASFNDATEDEILLAYGIKHKFKIVLFEVSARKIGNITYAIKASSYVKKKKSDIALGRSVTALSMLSALKCKVSIDIHGPIWEFNKLDYLLFNRTLGSKYLNKLTVNSQALKDMYIEKGLYRAKDIVVAHNGSDAYKGEIGSLVFENIFSEKRLNVGYFGGLYEGRGVDLIIDLAKINVDIDFHLFGGAELEVNSWKNNISSKLNNVYFHGHVPHGEVPLYRQKCDILLAPYSSSGVAVAGGKGDSSKYMNPIKIVEYMSSGKAIITSDMHVLKEVLGEDGAIFADPNEIEKWQSALDSFKDKSLRDRYGDTALERFEEGLTWEARAQKLL